MVDKDKVFAYADKGICQECDEKEEDLAVAEINPYLP